MKIFSKDDYINNHIISSSLKTVEGNISAHGHNFFELEFIVDGTGIYEIDGIEYEIKKNTLFLMSPANVHSLKDVNATLINVMFSNEHNKDHPNLAIHLANSPCFRFDSTDGALLSSLLHELVKVGENDTSYSMLLINCVISKLYYNDQVTKTPPLPYIHQAILYMLENFQSSVTLFDTAKHLGLSAAYFSDMFRKQLGINYKDYLDDIRFSYAKKLLTLTNLSIKEIHFQSGFSDYTNFVRRFKQKYNMTPTDYRKNNHL